MTDVVTAPTPMTHRQVMAVLWGLMLGMFLAALDQTIVATALPTMVGELGGLEHLSWVVTAYLLASTVTSPLYGKISDLYGRKIVFQAAIVLFLAGSVLCGLSQNMVQLIAFRGLQGLGAGGLMVMAITIVGDILSPRERGRYQGYFGAVFAVASIAGPLLGGWFVDNIDWRWVFYINLPIGLVALFVTASALNLPFHRQDAKIDYLGAALLVGSVSALLLTMIWGGNEYPWGSPLIIGLGVTAVVLGAIFIWWENRTPEPVLPLRLFRDRTFTLTSGAGFIVGVAMFGSIVFLPLFLQVVIGASATNSGLLLVPMMFGIIGASVSSGRVITKTGRYRWFPIIGAAVATVALFLLSTMGVGTTLTTASIYMFLLGAGIGMIFQVLVLAVQNAVDFRDMGVATSASTFFRSLGGSVGTGLLGAIFVSQLRSNLARLLPEGSVPTPDLTSGPGAIAQLPDAIRGPVIEAFAGAVGSVFLLSVPIMAVALVLAFLMPEIPLRETANVGAAAEV
ncbi:MAG: MFS transporter [Actinobacteria bacterium]|nr:MFS transporter [Actinomycetota bacterium]